MALAGPIYFIDFEGSLASGILEYGIVTLDQGGVVATETRLCGPRGRIRTSDTALHGIDQNAVTGLAPFSDEFDRFAGLRERGPYGAHFAQAENSLIKASWPYPRLSPDFSRPGESRADWGPWLDSGRLYLQFFPGLPSGKLEDLVVTFDLSRTLGELAAQYCPVERRHFHCALFDALAGALLFLDLLKRPQFSEATLPWLLQMSTANPEKRANLQQREMF